MLYIQLQNTQIVLHLIPSAKSLTTNFIKLKQDIESNHSPILLNEYDSINPSQSESINRRSKLYINNRDKRTQ